MEQRDRKYFSYLGRTHNVAAYDDEGNKVLYFTLVVMLADMEALPVISTLRAFRRTLYGMWALLNAGVIRCWLLLHRVPDASAFTASRGTSLRALRLQAIVNQSRVPRRQS